MINTENYINVFKTTKLFAKIINAKVFFGLTKTIKTINSEEVKLFMQITSFLENSYEHVSIQQRMFHVINDNYNLSCCIKCNKLLNFKGILKGGYFGCGHVKCKNETMYATNIVKYNCKLPSQSEKIKQKRRETCFAKYGVDEPLSLVSVQDKRQTTRRNNKIKKLSDSLQKEFHNISIDHINNHIDSVCNACNTNSTFSIQKVYNGSSHLCQTCHPLNSSFQEQLIQQILDSHSIIYERRNRNVLICNKELDFYIPSKNLAIEVNGVYWHSDIYKDKNYHYNKFKECNENSISLLQFWEDHINKKPDIIKSIILSKLGYADERIFARNTVCKEITNSKISESFLSTNHLHGSCPSSFKIGLYRNDELVMIMTFGKRTIGRQKQKRLELLRMCSMKGTVIIGGASKLFSFFTKSDYLKNCEEKQVYTYSYNDLGTNSVYEKLGFELSSSGISYFYATKNERKHRYNFANHIVKRISTYMNGEDYAKSLGYNKCYDAGYSLWTYTLHQ